MEKRGEKIFSKQNDEDEFDDDDDDDTISSSLDLGDWRKFRATLIAQEEEKDGDDDIVQQQGETKTNTTNESGSSSTNNINNKKVSNNKENEILLEKQNSQLAKEYKEGVWAHTIAEPEVGGLLCRMPIEGELYWGSGYWKDRLDTMLRIDTMGPPASLMAHWFQMAERMLARELEVITASAGKNGILNPNDLVDESRELLEKYLHYKQTWQEVCLMVGSTQTVVINRPISQNINKPLAKLLLEGQQEISTTDYKSVERLINKTSYILIGQ